MSGSSSLSGSWTPICFFPQEGGDHRRPGAKKRNSVVLCLFFSIFCSSKLRSKFSIEKTSKKMRKSMILASQNPPKMSPKCLQNRRPKKYANFHRFLLEKCFATNGPTSVSYWFLQYFWLVGHFSSNRFSHAFCVQKTFQKHLKNYVQTL